MPVYPLIIAQYDLSGHRYRSEHWSLAVLESKQKAHIFQLVGNADTYAYEASTEDCFESASQTLCGGCLVGHVDSMQLEWMRTKLKEIPVVRGKPEDFDCQTWAIDALRMVRYANQTGIDIIEISTRKIKAEMLAEKERWRQGRKPLRTGYFNDFTQFPLQLYI